MLIILVLIIIGSVSRCGSSNKNKEDSSVADNTESSVEVVATEESSEDTATAKEASEETLAVEESSEDAVKAEESSEEVEEITGPHIYDNAQVVELKSGDGKNVLGTVTITEASKEECTEEALTDWYFNYVAKHTDSNYHLIVYNDAENQGVYSLGTLIEKDVELQPEPNGIYMCGDTAGSTYYLVDEAAKTISVFAVMADASTIENAVSKIDEIIPDDYKNSQFVDVIDVGGEEGALECNLTLVNPSFADADYQSIAVEIASKIKELDLGIGSLVISFQKDDFTLNALSSIDDLSSQDASEITTSQR